VIPNFDPQLPFSPIHLYSRKLEIHYSKRISKGQFIMKHSVGIIFRKPTLYPSELWAHGAKMIIPFFPDNCQMPLFSGFQGLRDLSGFSVSIIASPQIKSSSHIPDTTHHL
jgi:hypothetical protein